MVENTQVSSQYLSKEKVDLFNHGLGKVTSKLQAQVSSVYDKLNFMLDPSYEIVRTYHVRNTTGTFTEWWDNQLPLRGGMTIVVIQNNDTKKYHTGVARCSRNDCYDKKKGRALAMKRAYVAMQKGVIFGLPRMNSKTEMSDMMRVVYKNVNPKFITTSFTIVRTGE